MRLLGGVSDAVATHAHGPVVVVGDEVHENPNGPVVVGVDDSPAAKSAIKLAFEAADVRGVPLIAINSWDFGPYDAYNAEIWEQFRRGNHQEPDRIGGRTTGGREGRPSERPGRDQGDSRTSRACLGGRVRRGWARGGGVPRTRQPRGASCWVLPASMCCASRTAR